MCKSNRPAGTVGKYLPIRIKQGADFYLEILLKIQGTGETWDSSGYSVSAKLSNGKHTIEIEAAFPESGRLSLHIPSSITSNLKAGSYDGDKRGSYDWDCELLKDGNVFAAFYGDAFCLRDI